MVMYYDDQQIIQIIEIIPSIKWKPEFEQEVLETIEKEKEEGRPIAAAIIAVRTIYTLSLFALSSSLGSFFDVVNILKSREAPKHLWEFLELVCKFDFQGAIDYFFSYFSSEPPAPLKEQLSSYVQGRDRRTHLFAVEFCVFIWSEVTGNMLEQLVKEKRL